MQPPSIEEKGGREATSNRTEGVVARAPLSFLFCFFLFYKNTLKSFFFFRITRKFT
jgi:hypothetical protein